MNSVLSTSSSVNYSIQSRVILTSNHHKICSHVKYKVPTRALNTVSVNENLRRNGVTPSKRHRSANFVDLTMISGVAAANLLVAQTASALSMDNIMEGAASVYTLADGSAGDWFGGFLYSAGQQANVAVQDQLSALSFTSLAVIFGAGLVTSLSPCTLSVLPLTLGYIGAFGSGKSRAEVIGNSIAFSLGLATTLAILGVTASFAGKAYGQIGQGLPVAASGLAVIMGLNLLEVIELQLPSFFNNFDPRDAAANFPSSNDFIYSPPQLLNIHHTGQTGSLDALPS